MVLWASSTVTMSTRERWASNWPKAMSVRFHLPSWRFFHIFFVLSVIFHLDRYPSTGIVIIFVPFYFKTIGGDCIFWELCGREDFLASYHHVLTFNLPAVHLITISLREPLTVQLQQARFWLRFILDRIPPRNIGKWKEKESKTKKKKKREKDFHFELKFNFLIHRICRQMHGDKSDFGRNVCPGAIGSEHKWDEFARPFVPVPSRIQLDPWRRTANGCARCNEPFESWTQIVEVLFNEREDGIFGGMNHFKSNEMYKTTPSFWYFFFSIILYRHTHSLVHYLGKRNACDSNNLHFTQYSIRKAKYFKHFPFVEAKFLTFYVCNNYLFPIILLRG